MSLEAEIQQAWAEHGDATEVVAARLPGLCERSEPGDVAALAGLVIHVMGEHLGRLDDAASCLGALERHGESEALLRSRAVLCLCGGDDEGAELLFDAFGASRASHEARARAVAAGVVAARGRADDAARWLVRAASLTYDVPANDPAVRALAVTGNNVACALEERPDRTPDEARLLRSAAALARVAWERAGTWLEVERAEYRLAMTHLALGEALSAVTHALACEAICAANGADAFERLFAHEALCRALLAAGDREGAERARAAARACAVEVDLPYARTAVEKLDALF